MFRKNSSEPEGIRAAVPGAWYQYSIHGNNSTQYGRFKKIDNDTVTFSAAPVFVADAKGSISELREGDIGVPIGQIYEFIISSTEDVHRFVGCQNWHREYLDKDVRIFSGGLQAAGRVVKAFTGIFHLNPYFDNNRIVTAPSPLRFTIQPPHLICVIADGLESLIQKQDKSEQ